MLRPKEKGKILESFYSKKIKPDHIPLLISSKLLRQRGCGQVDLASFDPRRRWAYLYEVKSFGLVNASQKKRLRSSASFVGTLLNSRATCRLLQ